jgi:nicotinate dehydrogenase subunit B
MISSEGATGDFMTDTPFSRRRLLQAGGALVVAAAVPSSAFANTSTVSTSSSAAVAGLDQSQLSSWIAIRADNTVLARTGKAEIGNGILTALQQIVADELYVPFESVKLVFGDTAQTPSGGRSAGGTVTGEGASLRNAAAYARAALLNLASTKLGIPVSNLVVKDGAISGGSSEVTYAQLVAGNVLNVVMPTTGTLASDAGIQVLGAPTLKPASQYQYVGKGVPRIDIPSKVSGTHTYVGDIKLPGLLHARMIPPATLGSTLISAGELNTKTFPTSRLIVKNNLVAVLSPSEWEAINAAEAVAAKTKWSEWDGLSGSGNLGQYIRSTTTTYRVSVQKGDAFGTIARSANVVGANYEAPATQHGPIGPYVGVADVKQDGTIEVWSNSASSSELRTQIAAMMGTTANNVVVHWFEGSSQYGRTSLGADEATADAVILSSLVGNPVRVQWSRQEDHIWSGKSYGQLHDGQVALDTNGNIAAWRHVVWTVPLADIRTRGAILAGLPNTNPPGPSGGYGATWIYDLVPNVLIEGRGSPYPGSNAPNKVGLRANILRSPGDYQSVFGQESIMNEAAAAAGVDAIEYRIRHLSDQRGLAALIAVKDLSKWESRPSPSTGTKSTGTNALIGRGVALSKRTIEKNAVPGPAAGTWAAAVAEVSVNPKTGKVTVTKVDVAYDVGFSINPEALKHTVESGVLMFTSKALFEEVVFDKSTVTSKDWVSYPIMRIKDTPEINVAIVGNDPSAPVNAAGEPIANPIEAAVAGAFYDATGKFARTLPLRPARVKALLKA